MQCKIGFKNLFSYLAIFIFSIPAPGTFRKAAGHLTCRLRLFGRSRFCLLCGPVPPCPLSLIRIRCPARNNGRFSRLRKRHPELK